MTSPNPDEALVGKIRDVIGPDISEIVFSLDAGSAVIDKIARAAISVVREYGEWRAPGTREICENHVYRECAEHTGSFTFAACGVKSCPRNYRGASSEPPKVEP